MSRLFLVSSGQILLKGYFFKKSRYVSESSLTALQSTNDFINVRSVYFKV